MSENVVVGKFDVGKFGVGKFVSENLVSENLFRKIRCRKICRRINVRIPSNWVNCVCNWVSIMPRDANLVEVDIAHERRTH